MPEVPEPRYRGIAAMGHYAEAALRIAEESIELARHSGDHTGAIDAELQKIFAEIVRHDLEVERILGEILNRLPVQYIVPNYTISGSTSATKRVPSNCTYTTGGD